MRASHHFPSFVFSGFSLRACRSLCIWARPPAPAGALYLVPRSVTRRLRLANCPHVSLHAMRWVGKEPFADYNS